MPGMADGPHKDLMMQAIALEAEGQRALLDGDDATATPQLAQAAALYRQSWELAGPAAYGRLVGHLKAAILAGDAGTAAHYVREQIPDPGDSPVACYVLAMAALVLGEPADTAAMRNGSPAFIRTADALDAIARGDAAAYGAALQPIVADFEAREEHLTGVPIADTALMLERLAAPRGLAAHPRSALLPA